MDGSTEQTESLDPRRTLTPGSASDGLEELYTQSMPEAVGLAYLLTGDAREASGMADEAFLRATGRFTHRIARDRFQVALRRHLVRIFLSSARHGALEPDGSDANPEEDGPWRSVLSLPVRERVAAILRFGRGLSEEDVAHALGCSLADARSALSRSIERLEGSGGRGTPAMP